MIKRILALRYVCKKYNLKSKLIFFGSEGWMSRKDRIICVSLFQKNFFQVLYHEVGHEVATRSLKFDNKYAKAAFGSRLKFNYEDDVFVRLEEEAKASKFSMRFLKVKDRQYLKECWYTYTSSVAKCINASELDRYITTVAKYNKYFEEK